MPSWRDCNSILCSHMMTSVTSQSNVLSMAHVYLIVFAYSSMMSVQSCSPLTPHKAWNEHKVRPFQVRKLVNYIIFHIFSYFFIFFRIADSLVFRWFSRLFPSFSQAKPRAGHAPGRSARTRALGASLRTGRWGRGRPAPPWAKRW